MNNNNPELRYIVTAGEWVVIAPKRSSKFKKSDLITKKIKRKPTPKSQCPFENPQKNGNSEPYFWFPSNKSIKNWEVQVFQNKFPALTHNDNKCAKEKINGIRRVIQGMGYHDLVITRNHYKNFPDLDKNNQLYVFKAFIKRYKEISADKCVKYISIFQNWGKSAGASLFHQHYQIIAMPIIPSYISKSLFFSKKYFYSNKKCLHCQIIKKEKEENLRIIYENKGSIAFVPFAAKEPFQVNIFPKKHNPFFEDSDIKSIVYVIDAVKKTLNLIKKNINDPDYNLYIHTSPVGNKNKYKHYHWHIEIVPKSNISAGFELSTRVEINPVYPEVAAKLIRGENIS